MSGIRKNKAVLEVCDKPCAHCLFSKNKIVSDERRDDILHTLERDDQVFTCHEASINDVDVMCHGDYARDPKRTMLLRLAAHLELVRFVKVPPINLKR